MTHKILVPSEQEVKDVLLAMHKIMMVDTIKTHPDYYADSDKEVDDYLDCKKHCIDIKKIEVSNDSINRVFYDVCNLYDVEGEPYFTHTLLEIVDGVISDVNE